jgi:acyl-CoA synthetase (AMP-forming)/AMP-acid ligase II
MTTLAQQLRTSPPDRIAVSSPRNVNYRELQELASADRASLGAAGVLVLVRDVSVAVPTLVQLDGVIERMFLASSLLPLQTIWQLGKQVDCTVVVTDHESVDLPAGFRKIHVGPQAPLPAQRPTSTAAPEATKWLLSTTGTTGLPKIVSHSLDSLVRTTKKNLVAEDAVRWGLLYDYTRFAGLQVLLQALLSGATTIAPNLNAGLEQQVASLANGRCTHLSATPTLWRKLLMTIAADQLNLRQVTLGGEIADQRILDALRIRFPAARISHIYASTEAGVGFSVSDGLEGFPEDYLTTNPSGVALRVRDNRLHVKNIQVDAAYVGSNDCFVGEDGFVDTGDLVQQRGQRYRFLGRANGVINVGGNKVHPEQVERVLLERADVAEARVYAKKNPITGALVVADVVAKESGADPQALRAEIIKDCREKLERYQVPAVIRFVKEIETNASGKVAR